MEAWHEPYARAPGPLLAPSAPRWWLRPVFRRAPVHAMTHRRGARRCRPLRRGGGVGAARRATTGSSSRQRNAKLLDQFLSPVLEPARPTSTAGRPATGPGSLEDIRRSVAERAGADYTCTVKVPVRREGAAAHAPHDVGRGHRAGPLVRGVGLRLGHAGRGVGLPRHDAHPRRHPDVALAEQGHEGPVRQGGAAPPRAQGASRPATSSAGCGRRSSRCGTAVAVRGGEGGVVSIPVLAVGGIRTPGRGRRHPRRRPSRPGRHRPSVLRRARPAAPHPRRWRRARRRHHDRGLCQNSNLCVPAQMLGMKGACYNPAVVKVRSKR